MVEAGTHFPFPKAPDTYISLDSDTAETEEKTVSFFRGVLGYLGYTGRAVVFVQRKTSEFIVEWPEDRPIPTFSNDKIDMLILKGDRLLASVIKWRTDNNFTQVSFNLHFNEEQAEQLKFRIPGSDILSSDDQETHP